jgi:ankyrin repeat protein
MGSKALHLAILVFLLSIWNPIFGQKELRWGLLEAVFSGDSVRTDSLLSAGASPDACTPDSVTALMYAVDGNRNGIAELLLRYGANPDLGTSFQDAPIISAVKTGSVELIEMLLRYGADPSVKGPDGWSVLMQAAASNNLEASLQLLDAGADLAAKENFGRTAMHLAAGRGSYESLYALLDKGAMPSIPDDQGITPLMFAAYRGDIALIGLLMRFGADIRAQDKRELDAATYAVIQGQSATVYYMLDSAANDASWTTAARLALQTGQRKLYRGIKGRTGTTIKGPVGYALDFGTGMYWNGKDHFAYFEGSWLEAHTNLAFGITWMHRLGPVRVLDQSSDPWLQYREKRGAFLAGIGKPYNIAFPGALRLDVVPRVSAGITYARGRGMSTGVERSLLLVPELRLGLTYLKAGLHLGIARTTLSQDEISPWYFSGGISIRISRTNYKKLSLSI